MYRCKKQHVKQLTDRCSFTLDAVDGKARWITDAESLITDDDVLHEGRTRNVLHSTTALFCPVQFIHINRPLASNAQARAGSLANESCADERAATMLVQLYAVDLVVLQHR